MVDQATSCKATAGPRRDARRRRSRGDVGLSSPCRDDAATAWSSAARRRNDEQQDPRPGPRLRTRPCSGGGTTTHDDRRRSPPPPDAGGEHHVDDARRRGPRRPRCIGEGTPRTTSAAGRRPRHVDAAEGRRRPRGIRAARRRPRRSIGETRRPPRSSARRQHDLDPGETTTTHDHGGDDDHDDRRRRVLQRRRLPQLHDRRRARRLRRHHRRGPARWSTNINCAGLYTGGGGTPCRCRTRCRTRARRSAPITSCTGQTATVGAHDVRPRRAATQLHQHRLPLRRPAGGAERDGARPPASASSTGSSAGRQRHGRCAPRARRTAVRPLSLRALPHR